MLVRQGQDTRAKMRKARTIAHLASLNAVTRHCLWPGRSKGLGLAHLPNEVRGTPALTVWLNTFKMGSDERFPTSSLAEYLMNVC